MIKDSYPPLRQWLERAREDLNVQKAWLEVLEERLDLYEELIKEILKEKQNEYDGKNGRPAEDH